MEIMNYKSKTFALPLNGTGAVDKYCPLLRPEADVVLSPDGKQWRSPKRRKFLFQVRAVGALFRGKFLAGRQACHQERALERIAPA
jgi:hypothetical protein